MTIDTKNTKKALQELQKFTTIPVIVKDISEFTQFKINTLGAVDRKEDKIVIYLSNKCPEQSYLHELIHVILGYEGYPEATINEEFLNKNIPSKWHRLIPKLQADFSSVITHPEVFRRMGEEYSLDIDSYYKIQVQQKIDRFTKAIRNKNDPYYYFYRQQDILQGLDFFMWPDHNEKLLAIFKKDFPETYDSCVLLKTGLEAIGFRTPEATRESAKTIKEHIVNYGKDWDVDVKIQNMWLTLEI
jgi:hypothetical protein